MASRIVINRQDLNLVIEDEQLVVYHKNQQLKAYCLHELEQILYLVEPLSISSADLDFISQFNVRVETSC